MPAPREVFDWTPARREQLGTAALRMVLDWFDTIGERRLYPDVRASDLESRLSSALPLAAEDPAAILAELESHVLPGTRDNGHPRMFGYVQSSGTFVGALGDFLASAINANVTSWRSSPSGTTIERQVIAWMKEMSGFDPAGDGLLVSGGSMANMVAIAAATAAAHPDVPRRGVRALPGDPVVYASTAVHMSVPKAAAIAGLGRGAVRTLPVDSEYRLDPAALDRAIDEDRRAGRVPVCVVVNVGDVNTGAIDPLEAVGAVCRRHGVWLHGDGAYGGFARLAPSAAAALAGLDRLDSLSLDPHKWLFVPVDSGCVLARDVSALRRAFAYAADYVDVIATPEMSEYAFWDYGPELTRRFRALKIWMALKAYGVRAIAGAIEGNIRLARRLAALVDASADFERLAPVPLSIVNFRYVRAGADLDALNRSLMLRVQQGGRAYLSNAVIGGAFALRVCIVNHRTTERDLEELLDEIRRCSGRM
jgi:glutamate/tyrosine decarboxylase-like PLP-dependent enzyme